MRRIGLAIVLGGLVATALAGERAAPEDSAHARKALLVELGRRLFMDESVSRAGQFSCASCHDPEHGFSDARTVSVDENGPTLRHSQPVTDLGGDGFHWDGEFEDVRQLLVSRMAPVEDAQIQAIALLTARINETRRHTLEIDEKESSARRRVIQSMTTPPYYNQASGPAFTPNRTPIRERLLQDGRYDRGFQAVFDTSEPAPSQLIDALAAYLDTLETGESAYDRFLAGDGRALAPQARRGLDLFGGKAGCVACHDPGRPGERALFTDGKFHNTGVAARAAAETTTAETTAVVRADTGLRMQTFDPGHQGRFKTASLRDIARRPPYMHDGSLATLAQVVDYYDGGGTKNGHLDERIRPLQLTAKEKADLVAFLEALSAPERAGLAEAHPLRSERVRVRIVDLRGKPMRKFAFSAAPAGDRLAGASAVAHRNGREALVTDLKGYADVAMPLSTHVALSSDDHEIGLSRPIPDWTQEITLMATPRDTIALVVRDSPNRGTLELYDPLRVEGEHRMVARMKKVRRVSADSTLYAVGVGELRGVRTLGIGLSGAGLSGGRLFAAAVDLGGGQSEPVDLRFGLTRRVGSASLRRYGKSRSMPPTPPPEKR